ncbi:MAG: YbaN family protein [Nitrosomonas sp.]|nr:YbaN family protein [Nitrosomonas sp.]MDP1951519.1 YbaN family protein [Nitrosomonas sp.]
MQRPINEAIQPDPQLPAKDRQDVSLLRLHDSRLARWLYFSAGLTALILGIMGVVLPVLPTTPFILLAAACFARSSEHFHDKLLANRIVGPIIREWCLYRSIPRRAKRWAYVLMALSFGSSILIVPAIWHKVMLAATGIILATFIWRIPVRDPAISDKPG